MLVLLPDLGPKPASSHSCLAPRSGTQTCFFAFVLGSQIRDPNLLLRIRGWVRDLGPKPASPDSSLGSRPGTSFSFTSSSQIGDIFHFLHFVPDLGHHADYFLVPDLGLHSLPSVPLRSRTSFTFFTSSQIWVTLSLLMIIPDVG